jgi:hypothetical protein
MGRSLADHALIRIALGLIAAETDDWRAVVDNVRLMAVFNIENLTWTGSPEEKLEILTEARRVTEDGLKDLHTALLVVQILRLVPRPIGLETADDLIRQLNQAPEK